MIQTYFTTLFELGTQFSIFLHTKIWISAFYAMLEKL